jgi:hypothetical protein
MRWDTFILFTVIFLFLVPIPIKITLSYIDNHLCLYIYGFKIKLQRKEKKKKKPKLMKKISEKVKIDFTDVKLLVHKVEGNKFKPTVRMNISLDYGLWDAYSTGMAYGLISSLSPFIQNLLTIIFKVKKYNMELKPDFDDLVLSASVKSIIFINLAKIMYIVVILIKSIKFIKHKNNYACKNV